MTRTVIPCDDTSFFATYGGSAGSWTADGSGHITMTGNGSGTGAGYFNMTGANTGFYEFRFWLTVGEWVAFKVNSSASGLLYDANGQGCLVRTSGSAEFFNSPVGSPNFTLSTAPTSSGTAVRIGFDVRSSSILDVYVNGVLQETITFGTDSGDKVYLGAYNGAIAFVDEIVLADSYSDAYPTAPSGSGLARQILLDTPIGYWPMQDATGTSIADLSGNGHTGTLNNGPVAYQPGPAGGKAIAFDGANDQMSASMTTTLDLTAITFETWMFVTTAQACILGTSRSLSAGATVRFSCSMPAACDRLEAWNGASVVDSGASSLSPLNKWIHAAWVFNNTTVAMYANGVLLASPAQALGTATSQPFQVGGMNPSSTDFFTAGRLAHVAVFGSALTSTRIAAHYQAGVRQGGVFG